jgi:hypothetical protein
MPAGAVTGSAKYNDQFLLYNSSEGVPAQDCCHLMLWDSQSDQRWLLVENLAGAEDASLSATHAAWVAWGGPGKDVYYADLATREVIHVESTYDSYTAQTSIDGDWVVWEDDRNGPNDVYAVQIGAGTEVRLTDNGAWNSWPRVRNDVLCFRTTLWSGMDGWDLAVMDLTTGVLRRATFSPHPGLKCVGVDGGWLVYQQQTTPDELLFNKILAVDLCSLGILDDLGRVVPGG